MKVKILFIIICFAISGYSQSFRNKSPKSINAYLDSLYKYNPQQAFDVLNSELENEFYSDTVRMYMEYYRGNAAIFLGKYAESDLSFYSALDIARDLNMKKEEAVVYQSLGVLYSNVSDYDKSDSCNDIALEAYFELEDSSGITNIYINKGTIQIERESYDKALYYLKESRKYSNSNDQIIMISNNIGEVYLLQNKFKEAKKSYLEAYKFCLDCELPRLKATLSINLADLYLKQGELDTASIKILNALTLIDKHSYLVLKPSALRIYSDVLKAQDRLGASYAVFEQYVKLDDSINNIQNFNDFYQIEKSRMIKNQKDKINHLQEGYREWDIKLYLIILMSIIGMGFVIYFLNIQLIKLNKSKRKIKSELDKNSVLKEELDYKDNEIKNFAHHITVKNKLLEELKKNIGGSDKHVKDLVNKNLNLEKDRKEFYIEVDKLQDAFFLKLNQAYPGLTERDLQFAALLVVGMSSKEISDTLYISLEGVKKGRYRLRKKMKLETSENLIEQLKQV